MTSAHTAEYAEKVNTLLLRLGQDLVSLYESECGHPENRCGVQRSLDVCPDADRSVQAVCTKRLCEDVLHGAPKLNSQSSQKSLNSQPSQTITSQPSQKLISLPSQKLNVQPSEKFDPLPSRGSAGSIFSVRSSIASLTSEKLEDSMGVDDFDVFASRASEETEQKPSQSQVLSAHGEIIASGTSPPRSGSVYMAARTTNSTHATTTRASWQEGPMGKNLLKSTTALFRPSMVLVSKLLLGAEDSSETIRHRRIIMENGFFYCTWSVLLYFMVVFAVWNDTLGLVEEWDVEGAGPLGRSFDFMILVLFTLDILINFHLSFEDDRGIIVTNPKQIALHYLRTWFFFDLIVTFPYDLFLSSGPGARSARFGKILKSMKLFRLLKMIRVSSTSQLVLWDKFDDKLSRIVDYSWLQGVLKRSRLFRAIFRFCLMLFCESHLISCILLLVRGDSTKLEFQSLDIDSLSTWLRFLVVFKWTLVACATGITGAESLKFVVPHADPQIVKICLTFLFAANLMAGFGLLANVKGSDDMDLTYRLRMLAITLRKRQNVSRHSRNAVVQFHKSQAARGRAHAIMKLLKTVPEHLRLKISFETYAETICGFLLFRQGPLKSKAKYEKFLMALCDQLEARFYIAREVVIPFQHSLEGMYCRLDGGMIISEDASLLDEHGRIQPDEAHVCPDFFGIEAILAPKMPLWQTTQYTVVSVNQSEVGLLTRKNFDDIIKCRSSWWSFFQFARSLASKEGMEFVLGLAKRGLSEEQLSEYRILKSAVTSSYDLGLSGTYIFEHFMNDVVADVGEIDFDECTFMLLKERFWDSDHRGFKGSALQVCPRDGQLGSAIVDTLDQTHTDKATHFVSWCWRYTVRTVVSALQSWAKHQDAKDVYLWMCFFCNNQRSLLIEGNAVDLVDTFGQRLESIGKMIVLLDRYDNPLYTTRLWCIFESYTATAKNIPVDVALPDKSQLEFKKVVEAPFGFVEIMRKLTNIETEAAQASVPEDEHVIRGLIQGSIGFKAVNATVKAAITKWLAIAFEHIDMRTTTETEVAI